MATTKEIGIIGLGPMGYNMATVLHNNGYSLALYNRTREKVSAFESMENVYVATDKADLVNKLRSSQNGVTILAMVPGGKVTNELMGELSLMMRKDDIVIDGSNSYVEDSLANYKKLKEKGIFYLDVGCGGGPEDILKGFTLMVGGDKEAYELSKDVFEALCGDRTYGYVGPAGSGQTAKGWHNVDFYAQFAVFAETASALLEMKKQNPLLDLNEVLRLHAASPPITVDIPTAIYNAINEGKLPNEAPQIKVSAMVMHVIDVAKEAGVHLPIIMSIFEKYGSMS